MVEVRSRGRARSTSLQLSCLALALCSIACSQMKHLEHDVAQELEAMANRQAALLVESSNEGATTGNTQLSFSEAVDRASLNDEEMLALIHESRAQSLSIQQARSLRWPRLLLRVSAEVPVDVDGADALVFGGVFIQYDLLDALLAGDAVTAETMRAQQLLFRRQAASRRLARQLLLLVAELDAASTEATLSQQALEIADRALAELEERGASEGLLRGEARGWKDDRFRLAEAAWEAQWRWDLAAYRLAHMIGAGPGRVPVLTDGKSFIPKPDSFRDLKAVDREDFLRLWETREDLQAEQINLLLNEIKILNAKRSRWPRLRMGLGVGNVLEVTGNATASLVPRLSLSFPIADMGDTRRRVETARIQRDQAAAMLEQQARSLIKELEEARRQVALTLERLATTRRQRQNESERRRATEELWLRGRATSLTYFASQLTDLRARLDEVRAEHRFRTAAINFDSIRAQGPCESVIVETTPAPTTSSGKEAQNGHPGGH